MMLSAELTHIGFFNHIMAIRVFNHIMAFSATLWLKAQLNQVECTTNSYKLSDYRFRSHVDPLRLSQQGGDNMPSRLSIAIRIHCLGHALIRCRLLQKACGFGNDVLIASVV